MIDITDSWAGDIFFAETEMFKARNLLELQVGDDINFSLLGNKTNELLKTGITLDAYTHYLNMYLKDNQCSPLSIKVSEKNMFEGILGINIKFLYREVGFTYMGSRIIREVKYGKILY